MKRKQNWQTCGWCVKRKIDPPYTGARIKSFQKHCHKCEAAYLQETSTNPETPSLAVVYQLLISQQEQIACLQSEVARLKAQKQTRAAAVKALTARQCWDRRREHIQQIREVLGYKRFALYFSDYTQCGNILAAIMVPALEMRDDTLCLRGIDTTDVYCIAKQIWGKGGKDINLLWYKEELEKMGYKLDPPMFTEQNDVLKLAYKRFQGTTFRAGSGTTVHQYIQGLKHIWTGGRDYIISMTESYIGFENVLHSASGTIFDPVPSPELLRSAAGQ